MVSLFWEGRNPNSVSYSEGKGRAGVSLTGSILGLAEAFCKLLDVFQPYLPLLLTAMIMILVKLFW